MDFVAGQDDGALIAPGQAGGFAMAAHVLQRRVEIIDLIERFDLLLVAKKNIGMIANLLIISHFPFV